MLALPAIFSARPSYQTRATKEGKAYNFLMAKFHRYYLPETPVFITCVTHQRNPYFIHPENIELFHETVKAVQKLHPFRLLAFVLLPDHFHWIIQNTCDSKNFSHLMHCLKRNITTGYKHRHKIAAAIRFWQPQFYDHIIHDETDLRNHYDYIHWNPVKHGYVDDPAKWKESTFQKWVRQGMYAEDWGKAGAPAAEQIINMVE